MSLKDLKRHLLRNDIRQTQVTEMPAPEDWVTQELIRRRRDDEEFNALPEAQKQEILRKKREKQARKE